MRSRLYRYSFCLLLCSQLFANSPVYADEPDPTPTYEPLFVQPTEIPVNQYICPEGYPEGYLTETPSPEWLLHCSECIPQPTGTPWATDAPLPTWMPTYTPTVTTTPDYQPVDEIFLGDSVGYTCVTHSNNREGHTYRDLRQTVNWVSLNNNYDDAQLIGIITSIEHVSWSQIATGCNSGDTKISRGGDNLLFRGWEANQTPNLTVYSKFTPVDWSNFVTNGNENFQIIQGLFPGVIYEFNATIAQNAKTDTATLWGFQTRVYSRPTTSNCNATLQACGQIVPVYYGENPEAGPPEPTPVPENYCTEIEPEPEPLNILDFIPMPLVGPATCAGWPEFEIGSIFDVNFTVPAVQVCFRPIIFGDVQVFDMSVSMDWFIYVMGFVAVLRWFIR